MTTEDKLGLCAGCRDDFYNRERGGCWSLETARPVLRWRIGWWIPPDEPGAFALVETLNCHHEPGRFGFQEFLPDFAVNPKPLAQAATPAIADRNEHGGETE